MTGPYSAQAVANLLLDLAERDGEPLTQMKLHKLLYYAHGWHLAVMEEPLIDEPLHAWTYGPYVKSLRADFQRFGSQPINDRARDLAGRVPQVPTDDKDAREIVEAVWEAYKEYSPAQLMQLTHEKGTPWERTWTSAGQSVGQIIPDDQIKSFFVQELLEVPPSENG